ncbi:MAG: XRE family transcriptional regulator [Flavobacterium sp.]|nr:MAG: XRE family transcriptional regulator [Flavobacterium sp.]
MSILRLKEILTEKKLSGKDLAEMVNVTEATISNLVKGDSIPKKNLLISIAESLDVDVRELFVSTKKTAYKTIYEKNDDGNFRAIGEIIVNDKDK